MKKSRKILLIEPDYKNKYPPIGLMKIATYHRLLGDDVTFFKGNLEKFLLEQILEECLIKLKNIDNKTNWRVHYPEIKKFIFTKGLPLYDSMELSFVNKNSLITECLEYYKSYFQRKKWKENPQWDRVYVTTLFTFHWKITCETVKFAKLLVRNIKELKVGGVLASLLPKELEEETGIKPMTGLLDKPGVLDKGNKIIIDDLPLDYSILDEIDYEYPTKSAYFTFMTKGCTRTCAFCSVPKLEPTYKEKIPTLDKFSKIAEMYGEQRNLLLMDNNVLASPKFPEIIEEIRQMGFDKGSTYIEPNQLEIAIKNLKAGINDKAYIRRCYKLLQELLKRLQGQPAVTFYEKLEEFELLELHTVTKENLLEGYSQISDTYEKYRNKAPKQRYVDFNQGTDCRYVTEELMEKMSKIPIRPLRIAFDHLSLKKKYVEAVEYAAKYGIKELSNYILYNFHDTPEQLYERLKINVELCEKFDVHIYSFPMKYIPLFGEEAKERTFVGNHWKKKFIRAVQSIINVTKGIVSPGRSFFEKAFGKNLEEFYEILHMPETYIIYRSVFETDLGYTSVWQDLYRSLDKDELAEAQEIIQENDFRNINEKTKNPKILQLLQHYKITRDDMKKTDKEFKYLKKKFEKIIKHDDALNLTTTHDFEDRSAIAVHTALT